MPTNQALTPCTGNDPLSRHAPAFDGTNVDLSGGNFTPNVPCRGFYVGGLAGASPGNVTVITPGGNTVTYYNLPAGSVIPQAFVEMVAASTSATLIVAMV